MGLHDLQITQLIVTILYVARRGSRTHYQAVLFCLAVRYQFCSPAAMDSPCCQDKCVRFLLDDMWDKTDNLIKAQIVLERIL